MILLKKAELSGDLVTNAYLGATLRNSSFFFLCDYYQAILMLGSMDHSKKIIAFHLIIVSSEDGVVGA